MSTKYLGATFDIHGGGQDLEFPHHENEIAQSEAESGQKFVNYWMHNGFVTVGQNDEKMSKSLGNFVTVHEMIKTVDPQVLRFFMASTQYRRPICYSEDNLAEAKNVLTRMQNTLDEVNYRINDDTDSIVNENLRHKLADSLTEFKIVMDDDFNVQNGLTVVYSLLRHINQELSRPEVDKELLQQFSTEFTKIMLVFGVEFAEKTDNLDSEVEALIEERIAARANKDFARSDEIRDQLDAMGIILQDTPQGTKWKRNNE